MLVYELYVAQVERKKITFLFEVLYPVVSQYFICLRQIYCGSGSWSHLLFTAFVRILKTLEFREYILKALEVLENLCSSFLVLESP